MRIFLYRVITGQEKGPVAYLIKGVLLISSWIYSVLVGVRNGFFNAKILPSRAIQRPVISVGNVTWGGAGKTPFVLMLAEYFQGRGLKPAILTRGYSANQSGESDEVQMLENSLYGVPIGKGADRIQMSQKIFDAQPVDVFILDDGFQHRQVRRDLDIVLVDSTNPFGNGHLLPAGILREPVTGLKRAQIIVLTKINLMNQDTEALSQKIKTINPQALIVHAAHIPSRVENFLSQEEFPLSVLLGQKVIGFSSIADPLGFESMLKGLGLEVVQFVPFLDHHEYTGEDINKLLVTARKAGCSLVTTAKDEVKLRKFETLFGDVPCWILKIKMVIETHHEDFFTRINRILGR